MTFDTRAPLAIQASRTINVGQGVQINKWKMPEGYFIPAKQPMQVIYPRPDNETSTLAYHRNATVGVQMEIPIDVTFGSYPYKYEIVSGPLGASIGESYDKENYGLLRFTILEDDSYSFVIRVTDQEYNEVDITFSGTAGDSRVVYADLINGSDSATGTFNDPWQTLEHARDNAVGRPVGLMTGEYVVPSGGIGLRDQETRSVFGVYGETVGLDCSALTSHFGGAGSTISRAFDWATSDCFAGNFRIYGLPTVANDMRYFSTFDANHRLTQFKIHFDGSNVGLTGGDNPGCNFLGNAGTHRFYVSQTHCRFTDMGYSGNGFQLFDIYFTQYFSHQHNTYDGYQNSRYGLWVKGPNNLDVCINDNKATTESTGFFAEIGMSSDTQRVQVSYNLFISSNPQATQTDNVCIRLFGNNRSPTSLSGPVWSFRNTSYGEIQLRPGAGVDAGTEMYSENDVVIHDQTYPGAEDKIMLYHFNDPTTSRRNPREMSNFALTVSGSECHGSVGGGIVDPLDGYLLTGEYLQYKGQRGHEVYKP